MDVKGVCISKPTLVKLNTSSNVDLKPSMYLTQNMLSDQRVKQSTLSKKPFKAKAPAGVRAFSIEHYIDPRSLKHNPLEHEDPLFKRRKYTYESALVPADEGRQA